MHTAHVQTGPMREYEDQETNQPIDQSVNLVCQQSIT